MDLRRPLQVITPTIEADILVVLANADATFSVRSIHELIRDHSIDGVRKALDRLVRQGIVAVEVAGQTKLYKLNRRHLAAPHIEHLVRLFDEFLVRTTGELTGWDIPPVYAALFGSAFAPSGRMSPESDIDLFVVRTDDVDPDSDLWREQLDGLIDNVSAWTGNEARIMEMNETDVLHQFEVKRSQLPSPRLTLYGSDRYVDDILAKATALGLGYRG